MDDASNLPSAEQSDLAALTTDIVAAYVSHNSVQPSALPDLIASVHGALTGLGTSSAPAEPVVEKLSAAEIRKSIKPDGLVSLIDGRSYKTLKRHLGVNGLDAGSYRAKYGLPHDYPMVAASYAAQRSELAKSLGLGQIRRTGGTGVEAAAAKALDEMTESVVERGEAEASAPKKRVGRPRKAAAE